MLGFELLPAERGLSFETAAGVFFRLLSEARTSFVWTRDGWDRLGVGWDCGSRCLPIQQHNTAAKIADFQATRQPEHYRNL